VPFKADSAVEIMAMHISQPPTPVMQLAPWVPPEIDALVSQMLAKDPAQRPTAQQVRERIAACRARTTPNGMVLNPSQLPAAWTPGPHVIIPATPPHGVPTPTPMAPPSSHSAQTSGGGKKIALVLVLLLLVGGGVAAALVLSGTKDSAQVASNEASGSEPAKTEPAKTEPVKTEPVKTEKPEPAGSAVPVQPAVPVGSAAAGSAAPAAGSTEPAGSAAEPAGSAAPTKIEPVKPPVTVKTVEPPKKKTGKVNVYFAGPRRALILVDGKPMGRESDGTITIELPPGEHTIRVQSKAFKPGIAKVTIEAGATKDIRLSLEKKSSVNNVHDPFAD
jgi:serine/threonine-protein kinase